RSTRRGAGVYSVGVSIRWILRARERAQMSATPPEADLEYSRGSGADPGPSEVRGAGGARASEPIAATSPPALRAGILAGGLLGALLLLVAEFTSLFEVHAGPTLIRTVGTGSHQGYALVPLALLVGVLSVAVWRTGSRPALSAVGLLGLIALLIALVGDLPDAKASGLVFRGGHYVSASSRPSAGMYLETLGAVILLGTSVCGFTLAGAPPRAGRATDSGIGGDDG